MSDEPDPKNPTPEPESESTKDTDYDDDLIAAVKAAQASIVEIPDPVPADLTKALDIRLKAAAKARSDREVGWRTAGNKQARHLEAPYLRINASSPVPAKKATRRTSRKK